MQTSRNIAQIHKVANEGSTGSILKEHRQENYAKIVAAVKQIPLGPRWTVLYSESSVSIHTLKFSRTIKISINARVYVDRKLKTGVRSTTLECKSMQHAIDTAIGYYNRFNKTGEVNEQSVEAQSSQAA